MVTLRRFRLADADSARHIDVLRSQLSMDGSVVSPRGRALTEEVFGEALTPQAVVDRILADVRTRGLAAVLEYSRKLDKADLSAETLRVSAEEIAAAHRAADPAYLAAIRRIRDNIHTYQSETLHQSQTLLRADHELRIRYEPVRRVGLCVPGGAAAYPSTLLMTAVPAQAAGVKELVVIAPPTRFGANNPDLLAACAELEIAEVYRLGGAQGVATLAYGVEGVAPVDMIVGPGSLFVALAKQRVAGTVGIDMLAGPTEVIVLADDSANPDFVASDLISQAEHAPGVAILVTWSERLADAVATAIDHQLNSLDRATEARESLEQYGAIVLAAGEEEACAFVDTIAPEHLQISTADPEATFARIHHAGATFLGPYTPVAVGDYVAGPSHTLPTGGTARFASALSANQFLKGMTVVRYTRERLAAVADDLRILAAKEGLTAHSRSVDIRLES